MAQILLNVENIHKTYGEGKESFEALRGVSLELEQGEMLGQIVIYSIFKNGLAAGHVGVHLNNAIGITVLLMVLSLTLISTVKNVIRVKKIIVWSGKKVLIG